LNFLLLLNYKLSNAYILNVKVYRVKQKKKKTRILKIVLPFFSIVLLIFIYMHFIASPIIIKSTYAQIDSYATTEVSDAIKDTIQKFNYKYEDLVTINYNSKGNVSSIIANSININLLAREVSSVSQIYIDRIIDKGVDVPIGTFSCLNFLAGKGSKINFKLVPIGSILTTFDSSFESVGINQTLHSVSIVINTTMTVVLPLTSKVIDFETEILVCENLIVGEVPNFYFSKDIIN